MSGERRMDPLRRKAVWGGRIRVAAALLLAAASVSCGTQTTSGTGSSYLILTTLLGAAGGASQGQFAAPLQSDVLTVVNNVPTVLNDLGQATFQLALKDPGSSTSPTTPSVNNAITLDSYHVEYVRSDGRNTQGVDVPYAFDSQLTTTVTGTAAVTFTLVRLQAKLEAPLAALASNNIPITTVAHVTFYGHDQTGRTVSVSGSIEITFANFAG